MSDSEKIEQIRRMVEQLANHRETEHQELRASVRTLSTAVERLIDQAA